MRIVTNVDPFLRHKSPLLIGAAATSIGLIGRLVSLPLDKGKTTGDGSPNAKKPAVGTTQLQLVETLLDIMNNAKLSAKVSFFD